MAVPDARRRHAPRPLAAVAVVGFAALAFAIPAFAGENRDLDPELGTSGYGTWVAILFAASFVAPFVDPRRPFRLLTLDLAALLAFGASHAFFNRGELTISVPLAYAALVYVLLRMLLLGFRPRRERGPMLPIVTARVLAVGLVVLVAARIALALASPVTDVGQASVIGADRIMHGQSLYSGFPTIGEDTRGDVYPPLAYLAYVPFEAVFPWHGTPDDLDAAYAAAIVFDISIVLALLLLGRRLRPGPEGRLLGLVLAYAWAAYPYSLYALGLKTNDILLALLVVLAFLFTVSRAPAAGGVATAVGAVVKGVPLVIAPLLASTFRRRRDVALYLIVTVAGSAALLLPFVLPDGIARFYERTVGYQTDRRTQFTLWGQHPSFDWVADVLLIAAIGLALIVAVRPREKTAAQVAALGAAVIVAFQLGSPFWYYPYVAWFAPLALVAVFSRLEVVRAVVRHGAAASR